MTQFAVFIYYSSCYLLSPSIKILVSSQAPVRQIPKGALKIIERLEHARKNNRPYQTCHVAFAVSIHNSGLMDGSSNTATNTQIHDDV